MMFKGAIYDLDGVVVDTVPLHFKAWQRMFNEHGYEFSFDDYKAKVDGIPRIDGASAIMTRHSKEEIVTASAKKQTYFLEYLEIEKIPIFESTVALIHLMKKLSMKVGVISSSKNCIPILKKIGLHSHLDTVVDGHAITKGKPDPQIFLMAAQRLSLPPTDNIAFEDAVLGVEAAKGAGMTCIGIDRYKDPNRLQKADMIVSDLSEFNFQQFQTRSDA